MAILRFLNSLPGRVLRVILGLALIATGASLGGGWWLLAVVGLLPLAAGLFNFCTLGPLFHQPLSGRKFQKATARQR
ncbi:MAG TPA: DUF2892 domain-containing protein [Micromonosporaceae bacterium]|nr:DUF2892 domain-containing protein [Micromonosporaceae bacterium]